MSEVSGGFGVGVGHSLVVEVGYDELQQPVKLAAALNGWKAWFWIPKTLIFGKLREPFWRIF